MAGDGPLTLDALRVDPEAMIDAVCEAMQELVLRRLRKRGAVIGVSGGIDSSVATALCARALGAERVLAVLMPESESSDDTLELSRLLTSHLGVAEVLEDITPLLDATGCYRRRDEAIAEVVPEFGPGWKAKLVLPSVLEGNRLPVFSIVVESPDGEQRKERLSASAYRAVVAATNFKQRSRKMLEYYHADRLDYAVIGTPNRLEYDQGFFVKGGDGAADVKPIAHLYKTQVYALAEHLGIPDEIRSRPPTTDTYSLPQSQEEFYFSVPYEVLDLCMYALNNGVAAARVTEASGLSEEDVERVFRDIESKRRATRPLHEAPLLVGPVPEIGHGPSS